MKKKNWKFYQGIQRLIITFCFLINFFVLWTYFCVLIQYQCFNIVSYYFMALLSFNNGLIIGDYIKLNRIKSRSDFVSYSKYWSKYINDEE